MTQPPWRDHSAEIAATHRKEASKPLRTTLVFVALIAIGLLVYAASAWAHEAPTGWAFDPACCGNGDCKPIAATDVRETPNGYLIEPTKELIPYQSPKVRISPDGMPYRCSVQGKVTGATYCLYISKGGF